MLPRKIELEQKYLEEALELLTSQHSESQEQILHALFSKPTLEVNDITFDTDTNAKANNVALANAGKRGKSNQDALVKAVCAIRAGAVDSNSLGALTMSASSMMAATAALNRAHLTGRLGKGGKGMVKRSAQRTAGILAMRAATSSAVGGGLDGVHGADPSVIATVTSELRRIFGNHGAVQLKTPLLRPRPQSAALLSRGGPAELLNQRGLVLQLPEDLTASFARSLGRGGTATANLKRFDIDRVYHKSVIGGHPRESIEASFDIIQDDHQKSTEIMAEAMFVCQQVLSLAYNRESTILYSGAQAPLWFLRIGHTRLSDALLDICGVPARDAPRKYVLELLSHFSAPSPFSLTTFEKGERCRSRRDELNRRLKHAVANHGLPKEAVRKIEIFFTEAPLSPRGSETIEYLKRTISKLRSLDSNHDDPKRLKRYEDAAKNLRALSHLVKLLESHLQPYTTQAGKSLDTRFSRPLYLSIDLGLRQRRKTYHGGVLFQAIVLPDTYFDDLKVEESIEELVLPAGGGLKVAEGGEFSDLVRRNRPPGNFASTFVQHYTTSPIPFCFGVRFAVGKLVELLYVNAAMDPLDNFDVAASADISQMRKLLGHPLENARTVDCMVASANGMDSTAISERFQVATRLWREGISAEYLAHSGVMLSLLKRIHQDDPDAANTSDWSLVELYGVCAILKISFVVIVQPHLLKDKESVRLVRVTSDAVSSSESFVSLDNLSSTILGESRIEGDASDHELVGTQTISHSQTNSVRSAAGTSCIYVEQEQYYGGDHENYSKSETPHWKSILKTIKKVQLQAESFLNSMGEVRESGAHGVTVFAVSDASFFALRDFGTSLMRSEKKEQSANGAYLATAHTYPKYKRSLKTLSVAIDNYMRRQGIWTGRDSGGHEVSGSSLMTILLYSRNDDRFDMVTLNLQPSHRGHSSRRK